MKTKHSWLLNYRLHLFSQTKCHTRKESLQLHCHSHWIHFSNNIIITSKCLGTRLCVYLPASRPGHSYDCSIYNIYNTVDSIGVIIIKFGQQETNMDDHKNNCSGIVYYDIVWWTKSMRTNWNRWNEWFGWDFMQAVVMFWSQLSLQQFQIVVCMFVSMIQLSSHVWHCVLYWTCVSIHHTALCRTAFLGSAKRRNKNEYLPIRGPVGNWIIGVQLV